MVWTGLTSPESLAEKRPYVIVGAFIVGMVLTPPDAISQTLLAIPMWMLFEVGLLFSRLFVRKQDDADDMVLEARLDALEKQEDE
jgi:sec-independent protein translocase protein TatC